jgi:hypothetical protein
VDTDLRASLVAAGVAAALSALVGLISGVGFLALILRAILGGALFGALAYGAFQLARRLLPGIEAGGTATDGEPVQGRIVDIVLPGEGEAPESIQASKAPSPGIFTRLGSRDDTDEGGSLLEPEPSVPQAVIDVGASIHVATPSIGGADGDDLDLLPDLEGFSDSFAAPEYKPAATSPSTSRLADSGTRGGAAEGMDPSKMAQAVRTILKRDQKG